MSADFRIKKGFVKIGELRYAERFTCQGCGNREYNLIHIKNETNKQEKAVCNACYDDMVKRGDENQETG